MHCSSFGRGVVCLQYFRVYLQLRLTLLRVHTWNQWMEQNEPVHAIVANPLKPGVKWEQPSDIITTLAMRRPHWIQLVALDKMLTCQSNLHRSTFRQSRNAVVVLKWMKNLQWLGKRPPKWSAPLYCSASCINNHKFHIRSSLYNKWIRITSRSQ